MSWGAVLAGAAIAVVVGATLNILGLAIGANLVEAGARETPDVATITIGGGAWMLASHLIGLAAGAYAAARLSGTADRTEGMLHGLAMWATSVLLATLLLGNIVGGIAGTAVRGLSSVVGVGAEGLGSAVSAIGGETAGRTSTETLQNTAQSMVERAQNALTASGGDPTTMNADQRKAEIGQLVGRRVTEGNLSPAETDRLVALVAAEAGISQEEARNRIQQVEQQAQQTLQEAEEQARQVADAAAAGAAAAAYWTFGFLVLGAVVSAQAARSGTRSVMTVSGLGRTPL